MIPADGHLRYSFTPKPAGSRWYHSPIVAGSDLTRSPYSGQFGFLYIDSKSNPGAYDQEVFFAVHHWEPSLTRTGRLDPYGSVEVNFLADNPGRHSPTAIDAGFMQLIRYL